MDIGFALIPIIFMMLIPLAIFALLIIGVVIVIRTIVNRNEVKRMSEDEQLQFRRMMDALKRMEERVANLETILNQREGGRPSPGSGAPRPAEPTWPFNA